MIFNSSPGSAALPPPQKRSMGPLGWIAIGWGVVILCGLTVLFVSRGFVKRVVDRVAIESFVRAHPDLEIVSQDESAGTITIKNRKIGWSVTARPADFEKGRVSFGTTARGTSIEVRSDTREASTVRLTDPMGHESVQWTGKTARELPSWVPSYPGASAQGSYGSDVATGRLGNFLVFTKDPLPRVIGWYEARLRSAGLAVEKSTYTAHGGPGGVLEVKSGGGQRIGSVNLTSTPNGGTMVHVFFDEKRRR